MYPKSLLKTGTTGAREPQGLGARLQEGPAQLQHTFQVASTATIQALAPKVFSLEQLKQWGLGLLSF